MTNEPLQLGLVGLGNHMLENLWPALRVMVGHEILLVSSRDSAKAATLARERGAWGAVNSWEALVDDERLDAVVVASTPDVHEEVVARCIACGRPVYVEKPPARNSERLEALAQLEAKSPRPQTFVGYNFRFGEGYRLLRQALERAEPTLLRVRFLSSKPRSPWLGYETPEESYLWGVAIHPVELVLHALGPPIEIHTCWTTLTANTFALDVVMTFSEGRSATLALGNYGRSFAFDVECVAADGSHGRLSDQTSLRLTLDPSAGPAALGGKEEVCMNLPSSRGGYDRAGYTSALNAFLRDVRTAQASASTLAASRPVYAALDAIFAARR